MINLLLIMSWRYAAGVIWDAVKTQLAETKYYIIRVMIKGILSKEFYMIKSMETAAADEVKRERGYFCRSAFFAERALSYKKMFQALEQVLMTGLSRIFIKIEEVSQLQ